jgi:hypothetical protein
VLAGALGHLAPDCDIDLDHLVSDPFLAAAVAGPETCPGPLAGRQGPLPGLEVDISLPGAAEPC